MEFAQGCLLHSRLAYSAHDYPSFDTWLSITKAMDTMDLYNLTTQLKEVVELVFGEYKPDTYAEFKEMRDQGWGYLKDNHTLLVGEFGTGEGDSDWWDWFVQ